MLALRDLLIAGGVGLMIAAAGILAYDLYRMVLRERALDTPDPDVRLMPVIVRWRTAVGLVTVACGPMFLGLSIVVVPSGMGGVRVSQVSGTVPGTLDAGAHMIVPLVEDVVLFDTRDQIFTTGIDEDGKTVGKNSKRSESSKSEVKTEPLDVQAKEGLTLGLSITVRYRLDAKRLDYIQENLPHPVEKEIVPPTVASVWREVVPNYTVRDVFSAKREEVRQKAAAMITQKLAADGIVVKEVMLRDIQLPEEYAEGLQTLLLKEQENDRMSVETELKGKEVKIAELEAEAEKARQVKQAEGAAQVRVLQAKAESDAMQYTLPLKQKQIEETKLEAEAHKEATIQNAEADAQAKLIDGKAEGERQKVLAAAEGERQKVLADAEGQRQRVLAAAEGERQKIMADAEANRIRLTSAADAERMQREAAILKGNPLLINKIVAERLSDKLKIMMVPADGKYFFANDVLQGMNMASQAEQAQKQSR
jgi:regulator of protease activity HflC (stomatin/prohibitin superfamily)